MTPAVTAASVPETVEATLIWSDPEAEYLGCCGEENVQLTPDELWSIATTGLGGYTKDRNPCIVTSVLVPTPQGWTTGPHEALR